jgi:uncharacterized FAD-dependent dehydrogenase
MLEEIEIQLSPLLASSEEQIKDEILKRAKRSGYVRILKKSLDARSKNPFYLIRAGIYSNSKEAQFQAPYKSQNVEKNREVHIVGAGPAGLFSALECIAMGLKPVIIERGKAVRERRRDLAILNKELKVDPNSNYCFGEGGAGTYSDGKLYTRSKKRGSVSKVLETFVQFGANKNILYDSKPHIGTNKLPGIIEKMRTFIEECGGEVLFNHNLVDLTVENNEIKSILCENGVKIRVKHLVLATGHSARNIYRLLQSKGIAIEAKPFAFGVRIEHPQEVINEMQYRKAKPQDLPNASYNLVEQVHGCGVFSFCMCPGGIIAPAATSPGEIVVNGWSPSKRNGRFANSGFVTEVNDADFSKFVKYGELRGMEFQNYWEKQAFKAEGSLVAPAQRMEDFLNQKTSSTLPSCSYIPGISAHNLWEFLPEKVAKNLREAIQVLGQKKKWYKTNEAVLVGVESRTSSPVRIPRNEYYRHPEVSNMIPCAEGAGYAGGILSAALDGINCTQTLEHDQ